MEIIEHISNLPMLGNDAIHIWGARVPELEDRLDALKLFLCTEEAEKAERFHRPVDRASSIVARGALRVLLSGYTGIPADEISFHYSENGKPYLAVPQAARLHPGGQGRRDACGTEEGKQECPPPVRQGRRDACGTEEGKQECPPHEIEFNLSHSGEWVVLAIGRNRNIGVDVEQIRRDMDVMSIASRYFMSEESTRIENVADMHASFFHHWARKEAYVKATGSGLFRELSSFAVPDDDCEKDGWIFQRLDAGSNYAAAVVTDKPIAEMPCFDFAALGWEI